MNQGHTIEPSDVQEERNQENNTDLLNNLLCFSGHRSATNLLNSKKQELPAISNRDWQQIDDAKINANKPNKKENAAQSDTVKHATGSIRDTDWTGEMLR